MKLNMKDYKRNNVNCFGIYWDTYGTHYVALLPDHGGPMVFDRDEVEIIDPYFSFKTCYFENGSTKFLLHWALVERNLFDDAIGHVESAYLEFLKIIKEEGLVEPDFY